MKCYRAYKPCCILPLYTLQSAALSLRAKVKALLAKSSEGNHIYYFTLPIQVVFIVLCCLLYLY